MTKFFESATLLAGGALVTVELFLLSAVLAIVMSIIAGLLRLAPSRIVRIATTCYVEVFRGTSLVVQLFWLYFALPSLGISLEAFPVAVLALGLCFGAYGSEVVRGAIRGVPSGQYEAATALNMGRWVRMRSVIFPQALALLLPPYTNILVQLLKSTAAASFITIPELVFRATSLNQVTFATVPIFGSVLVVYFLISLAVSQAMRAFERRTGKWRWPNQTQAT
jgi:polar amino acid transport system permease protein